MSKIEQPLGAIRDAAKALMGVRGDFLGAVRSEITMAGIDRDVLGELARVPDACCESILFRESETAVDRVTLVIGCIVVRAISSHRDITEGESRILRAEKKRDHISIPLGMSAFH